MANFLDFQFVKEQVSFASAIELLGLKLKQSGNQWRGPCPSCQRAGDRALVITDGRGWYCWGIKRGGDQIALAQHILSMAAKEAAQELAERAGIIEPPERKSTGNSTGTSTSRDRPPERDGEETQKFQPLSYLESENDAVVALGLDPKFCERHGIGYAPRGVVRGSVAIPFRDEQGTLLGYFGCQELTYVPADFTTNVVPLRKKA